MPIVLPLILGDAVCVTLCWLASFALRFRTSLFDSVLGVAESPAPIKAYLVALPLLVAVVGVVFWRLGFYSDEKVFREDHFRARFEASLVACVLLLASSALYRGSSYSRASEACFFVLLQGGLWLVRCLAKRWLEFARAGGLVGRRVLVVGSGERARGFLEELSKRPWLGFEVLGLVSVDEVEEGDFLGSLGDLARICEEHSVEEVFVALEAGKSGLWKDIEELLRGRAVDFHVVVDTVSFMAIRPRAVILGGLPIVTVRESPGYGWNRVLKRGLDVMVGSLALILGAPVMALVAFLIKLGSRGPVFYTQERVGWAGQHFTMIKFRTMNVDAERGGPRFAVKDDPRRTWIGGWLRRTSLDELPQLWNVLRGEMSLVGPRPERPEFLPVIAETIPHFALRQAVKAGMTGWAQIHGQRGQAPLEERLKFDLEYVKNWSLLLDIRILLVTLCGGFLSRNAI